MQPTFAAAWLNGLDKFRSKGAVEMILKWYALLLLIQLQNRLPSEKLLYNPFVFLRLETAGAVNQGAAPL